MEFSRIDRNKLPLSGQENGRINDHISDLEQAVLSCLRDDQCGIDCKNRKIPAYDHPRSGFAEGEGIDQPYRFQKDRILAGEIVLSWQQIGNRRSEREETRNNAILQE